MNPVGAVVRYLADKLAFAAGLLLGSQVPAFILQYRQRLGGRLDQARIDLSHFQQIADRLHGGSLEALIRHHLGSASETFRSEGEVVRRLAEQVRTLAEAYQSLGQNLFRQIGYLATHLDADIARATFDAFSPAVVLTPEALALAFCTGLLASAMVALLAAGARRLLGGQRRGEWR